MKKEQIIQGGAVTVPRFSVQTILLDFDGEQTGYNGEILTVGEVEVQDSGLTQGRIETIVARLNAEFAALNVTFTADPAEARAAGEYSTVYVGRTSAFAPYGNFTGLAETIDRGNVNRTDKAFVMLDAASSDEAIVATIAHEAGHLLGTLDHGGSGLAAYAAETVVSSGKTNQNTMVNASDTLIVENGGTAVSPTVAGTLIVEAGGTATGVKENGGFVDVLEGATVTFAANTFSNVTLEGGSSATVHAGTVASDTIVKSGAALLVYENGTASGVTVDKDGHMDVFGGMVSAVTVKDRGLITLFGGTVNNVAFDPSDPAGASMILSGGTANSVTINPVGVVNTRVRVVIEGGTINSAILHKAGRLDVSSGGTANYTSLSLSLYCSNYMYVSNGGTADYTTVYASGFMEVLSGGKANSTTVNGGGYLKVSGGGTADHTALAGLMSLGNGANADSTTVNVGGNMSIFNGATATNIIENGGCVWYDSDAILNFSPHVFSSLTINAKATVHSGTTALKNTVISNGMLDVFNKGIVSSTTLDGSKSNRATLKVESGGTAIDTVVAQWGDFKIFGGGTASKTAVSASLTVSSGSTAVNASMTVSSDGKTTDTTVRGGVFYVLGGFATSNTIDYQGQIVVSEAGSVDSTIVSSGGTLQILEGSGNGTTINSGGKMTVASDGIATAITENGGYVEVADGATVSFVESNVIETLTLQANSATLHAGATARSAVVSEGGKLHVFSGGVVSAAAVSGGGSDTMAYLTVFAGGSVSDMTLGAYGSADVHGTAENTVLASGAFMTVASGGVHRGSLVIGEGASFQLNGGTVDFTLTGVAPDGADYLLNDLAKVSGTPEFSITVAADQASGEYKLGQNAGDNLAVTVKDGEHTFCNLDLTVTPKGDFNGVDYYLNRDKDANLTLIILGDTPWIKADNTGLTDEDVTLTALFNTKFGQIEYSFDQTDWKNHDGGGIPVTQSCKVYFRGTTGGAWTHTVDNIDKDAPVITVAADTTEPTNGNVTVSATFEDAHLKTAEYSLDNENWTAYTQPIVMKDNGTVYFRAEDKDPLGHVTTESYVVANIDREAPAAPAANADVTGYTNQNVTVSATFSEDSAQKQYSRDGENFAAYENGIVMEDNGTVYFRGIDAAGNISEVTSYTVNNIDKEAPVIIIIHSTDGQNMTLAAEFEDAHLQTTEYSFDNGTWAAYIQPIAVTSGETVYFRAVDAAGNVSAAVVAGTVAVGADVTALTNQDVTVTAVFSEGTTNKEYSLDGRNWQPYDAQTGVVMEGNGVVYFRGTDTAGRTEAASYAVTNIDKDAPVITASADITGLTNGNVTVSALFEDAHLQTQEYSFDNSNWTAYTRPIVMEGNGTLYFRATDAAGNISEVASYAVTNIDKAAPAAPAAVPFVTEPTYQNVTVGAVFSEDSTQKQYSLDGANWAEYTQPVVMTENGMIYFRGIDAANNVSGVTSYAVTNIDRTPPDQPAVSADITVLTNRDVTLTAVFSEDSVRRQYSPDGANWTDYTGPVVVTENGVMYFRGIDAVGNLSLTGYSVGNIDKTPPAAPTQFQNTITGNQAVIDWEDVADNGLAPLAGYEISYGNSPDLGTGKRVGESTKTLNNLSRGVWFYRVRTLDATGNASEWSKLQRFVIAPGSGGGNGGQTDGKGSEAVTTDAQGNIIVSDAGSARNIGQLDPARWQVLDTADYDKDGVSNLLVQDLSSGIVRITGNVDGGIDGSAAEQGTVLGVVSGGYSVAGAGNFNGSDFPGALLVAPEQVSPGYSKVSGLACWTLDNAFNMSPGWLGAMVTTWDGDTFRMDPVDIASADDATINAKYYSFELAGVGDFNGDGVDDVMIRNNMPQTAEGRTVTGSGDVFVFLTGVDISGYQEVNVAYTGRAADPWQIAGVGDFNGDEIDDVLLKNASSGEVATWLLDSTAKYAAVGGIGTLSAGQSLAGVGDVNGDGIDDVLFTDADGSLKAWTVQDGAYKGQLALS